MIHTQESTEKSKLRSVATYDWRLFVLLLDQDEVVLVHEFILVVVDVHRFVLLLVLAGYGVGGGLGVDLVEGGVLLYEALDLLALGLALGDRRVVARLFIFLIVDVELLQLLLGEGSLVGVHGAGGLRRLLALALSSLRTDLARSGLRVTGFVTPVATGGVLVGSGHSGRELGVDYVGGQEAQVTGAVAVQRSVCIDLGIRSSSFGASVTTVTREPCIFFQP